MVEGVEKYRYLHINHWHLIEHQFNKLALQFMLRKRPRRYFKNDFPSVGVTGTQRRNPVGDASATKQRHSFLMNKQAPTATPK